jgi:hypothetical protein
MKKIIGIFFIIILGIITFSKGSHNQNTINENDSTTMALLKATGKLKINKRANHDTYQVYFHVPIAFKEQVPIAIKIDCEQLIDYRFIHMTPPNVIISAQLKQSGTASLDWTGWVVVKDNTYTDCPDFVPLAALNELTAEEKKWLLSPEIDLRNTSCAYLSFWVWNWVEDQYGKILDPLWLDLTIDGSQFYPICSHMGGINDDDQIPDVGGWSRVVLDLSPYAGHVVRIRYRFQSGPYNVQAGSYIDDFHVYGRIQEFEKNPMVIELNASRKTERAWIIRKDYDEIELSINNPNQLKGITYDIFRREPGQYYQLLREITENEIQGNRYTLFYPLPDRDIEFQYLAVARDADDKILAIAYTKSI